MLDAQRAHDWAPFFVNSLARISRRHELTWRPFDWRGLHFKNRLGIAGGVDKDGLALESWIKFGAGFAEVGTITPLPQGPNPGPTVARDLAQNSLWNKLGFPSRGSEFVRARLKAARRVRSVPIFVNIGKNRDTRLEEAALDYSRLIRELSDVADAFVVNISSPNTQNLRQLQSSEYLDRLLREVLASKNPDQSGRFRPVPVLLKLSPDLTEKELEEILDVSHERGIDGWILTNTTRERPAGCKYSAEGGLSGAPLAAQSKKILNQTLKILGGRREGQLIVSVGGVMSPGDVRERLELGADLVQTYSALIFNGPGFFREVARSYGQGF